MGEQLKEGRWLPEGPEPGGRLASAQSLIRGNSLNRRRM